MFSVALFSATKHHSHFKLCMVLWLGVLRVAYQIHVHQLSTSCFTTYFLFWHNMVKCQICITLFSATMHYSHFNLGMVLWLGVLHITYQILICQFSTFCFTTYFIFLQDMVKCQIFVTLFSATMHHSHFKLGMVLWLGVLQVPIWIQVCHLSTSCFKTYFIFWHNMVKCQIFVTLCRGMLSE